MESLTTLIKVSMGTPSSGTFMASSLRALLAKRGPRVSVCGVREPGGVIGLAGRRACTTDGFPERGSPLKLAVEFLGKFAGGAIGDGPQRADERSGACLEELRGPSIKLVVGGVEPGAPAGVDEHGG